MAYSILEALYDGKVVPWERRSKMSDKRKALEEKIESEKNYFMEKMSPEDRQRFQELESLYSSVSSDEQVNAYSYGFSLGVLLMTEVMEKKEEIINE